MPGCTASYTSYHGFYEHAKNIHFEELWCPFTRCNYSTPDLSTLAEHLENNRDFSNGIRSTKEQLKAKYNSEVNMTKHNERLIASVYAIFPTLSKQKSDSTPENPPKDKSRFSRVKFTSYLH
uniref:C2H2-type domain-containing protein n=1 Tax=Heterorhabditis bacteriophora TaxID=37862 RepID=A0A1I7WQZ1_HETBA